MIGKKVKNLTQNLNFEVFYSAYEVRKTGIISASILIGLSFLEINIFLFQSYFDLATGSDAIMDLINNTTQFLYMAMYIKNASVIYIFFRSLFQLFNIGYLVLFLYLRYQTSKRNKVGAPQKLFMFFNTYYLSVLLTPSMELFFRDLFCDDKILSELKQECLKGSQVVVFAISLISLIAGIIMTALSVIYSFNGIYDKKNYLSGENKLFFGLNSAMRILIPAMAANATKSDLFIRVYLSMNILCSVILLIVFFLGLPFNKRFIEQFTFALITTYFAQAVAILVSDLSNKSLSIGYVFTALVIISVPASFQIYNVYKQRVMMRKDPKSINDLLKKIQMIIQLKAHTSSQVNDDQIFFKGLVSKHMADCKNVHCFCKKRELYDQKKKKAIHIDKWRVNKSIILKYLVRQMFENQIRDGVTSPELLISYAEFLFEKFRNTHLALHQIQRVINIHSFIYPNQQYRMMKLRSKISNYIDSLNNDQMENYVEIENVVKVEQEFERVLDGMQKILENSINFWKYLVNKEVELSKLKQLGEQMSSSVDKTTSIWGPLKPYLNKQKLLMFFYNWYLKDFIQRKVIISEEEADELFDQENYSVHSADFVGQLESDNVIFSDQSAIIHISGNMQELGRIIKTNNAASDIFAYTPEHLKKVNINTLMPKLVASKHHSYLESYIKTGKTRMLYQQRKLFGRDSGGFMIPLWVVIKQFNQPQGQIEYVGLLKPLDQKKDEQNYHVLLNNFGEISGMTKNLTEYIKVPGDVFEKLHINIVMLAPKLVKYFYFGRIFAQENKKGAKKDKMFNSGGGTASIVLMNSETNLKDYKSGQSITRVQSSISNTDQKSSGRPNYSKFSATKSSPFMGRMGKNEILKDFLDLDNLIYEDMSDDEDDGFEKKSEFDIDTNEREIEFTLRLPQNLEEFVRDFEQVKSRQLELLNNQQFVIDAIKSKALHRNSVFKANEDTDKKIRTGQRMDSKQRGAMVGRSKFVTQLMNSKHTFDAYIMALRLMAQKIANKGNNNVYRIKAYIYTDYYGPDDEVVKYIKITDIQTKVQNYAGDLQVLNQFNSSMTLSRKMKQENDEQESIQLKHLQKTKSFKVTKVSKFKTIEAKGDNAVATENSMMEDLSKSNIAIQKDISQIIPSDRNDPNRPEEYKEEENEKEEKEEENNVLIKENKSDDKTDPGIAARQSIVEDIKNSIMMQYQSIFYKEENYLIDRNFTVLNTLGRLIALLFLVMIPVNLTAFFVSTNQSLSDLNSSVEKIYTNEMIIKQVFRTYDAIMTLLLIQKGDYGQVTSLSTQADINALAAQEIGRINTAYEQISLLNPKNERTSVIYDITPGIKSSINVKYDGALNNLEIPTYNGIAKLLNTYGRIKKFQASDFQNTQSDIKFFRKHCNELITQILGEVKNKVFANVRDQLDKANNNSSYLIIAQSGFYVLSFMLIIRLLILVIGSLKRILETFTSIDNKEIIATEGYYRRLLNLFKLATHRDETERFEENNSLQSKQTKKLIAKSDSSARYTKKSKTLLDGETFLWGDTVRTFLLYILFVLLTVASNAAFTIVIRSIMSDSIDIMKQSQKLLDINSIYLQTLTSLKELRYSTSDYDTYVKNFQNTTRDIFLSSLDLQAVTSSMNWAQMTADLYAKAETCAQFKSHFTQELLESDCRNLVNGRLNTGLTQFHTGFREAVEDDLKQLPENKLGPFTMNNLYEYGKLVWIVDKVMMETIATVWQDNLRVFVDNRQRLAIIILCMVSFLQLIVYIVARVFVIKPLQEKFLFYRQIYNKYMLGEAITKEKRIIATLRKNKLLVR